MKNEAVVDNMDYGELEHEELESGQRIGQDQFLSHFLRKEMLLTVATIGLLHLYLMPAKSY